MEAGTLVILDGYDELSGELTGDEDANTFIKFCKCLRKFIRDFSWNVIITSRTMCIRRELDGTVDELGCQVSSFAPLADWQQEMMVDRMIELDRNRGERDEAQKIETYQKEVLPELRKVERMNEFLRIPILFRMIVKSKFKAVDASMTEAELYGKLFHNLMEYRGRTDEKEWELIKAYEIVAARIFNFNNDVCPLDTSADGENRELTYLFLTKNERAEEKDTADDEKGEVPKNMAPGMGGSKKGWLGFLHLSFSQYFLARYLISGIMRANPNDRMAFMIFFKSLRARRITETLVWQFVRELTAIKGMKGKDPFASCDQDGPVTAEHIKKAWKCLDIMETYEECAAERTEDLPGSDAERNPWNAAETAVFNMVSSLAAADEGCRKGVEIEGHNDYKNLLWLLRRGDYSRIHLGGVNLVGCNLNTAYLKNANMAGSDLRGANLNHADLTGIDFTGADLRGAQFEGANLTNAVLKNAYIRGTNFSRADMTGADLTRVNPVCASVDMTEAKYEVDEGAAYEDGDTDFKGANLSNARLTDARLENAKLGGANLSGADFTGARLEGADLSDTDLSRADMKDAILRGANLAGADLRDSWLIGADLENAHLEAVFLDRAALINASLKDAHLERAHMENAELIGANLTEAHLEGACMRGAFLDKLVPGEVVSPEDAYSGEAVLNGTHLAGADIYGAYLSETQYRYAGEAGAIGQPVRCLKGIVHAVGHVAFGRYKQGKDGEVLPLRWRVLKIENSRALLITEKLIAFRAYHERREEITWVECDLRKWLGGEFFTEAFIGEERTRIAMNLNENSNNTRHNTKGGCETDDRVFLLSLDEAKNLFHSDGDRKAVATPNALKSYYQSEFHKTFRVEPSGWWWLRSLDEGSDSASVVFNTGSVFSFGFNVVTDDISVRPALWINL